MLSLHCLVVVLGLVVVSAPAQNTIYVDQNAPAGGNGQSWATAHDTLQPALAQAGAGDRVWVAAGTYTGGFTVPAGVGVYGGFAAGDTRATQAQPMTRTTTLDGGGTQRVLVFGSGSVVDGFTVRNGVSQQIGGGGALIDGVQATLRNCVFTDNGNNNGGRGAALAIVNGANPLVQNCLFHRNRNSGHTVDVDTGSSGTYDHLTICDNPHNGFHMQGGVTCVITNCVFIRNFGSGICDVGTTNQPTLLNCLFYKNTISLIHYRGIEIRTASAANIFLTYASNLIEGDPLFVAEANADYRLTANSPAIDTGTGSQAMATDAYGAPRTTDGDLNSSLITDMGLHEFSNVALGVTGSLQGGGNLSISVTGAPTLGVVLVLSATTSPGFTIPSFGMLFLGAPHVLVPLPGLPSSVSLAIPVGVSGDVGLQAVGAGASNGNTSNLVDVHIR